MRFAILLSILLAFTLNDHPIYATDVSISEENDRIIFYDKTHFLIEGTAFDATDKESPYDRLPASYKEKVREPVWQLSKSSAGLSVRFLSNSSEIHVKWSVLDDFTMNHMASTGIKGIDLYVKQAGKWRYVNTARPAGKSTEVKLVQNMSPAWREYRLFLPLYDGVTDLEVGIEAKTTIKKPVPSDQKPIVFYGTSITQGGCASRPGMAHTNIISRKLGVECINFGFSGNGRMEEPIVELISEIDASFFVIECLQNMDIEGVKARTAQTVKTIRQQHPTTPIIFSDNMLYEVAVLDKKIEGELVEENAGLFEEYQKLVAEGVPQLFYIHSAHALGEDHEGTVDGVHLTDLGFLRYADHLIAHFKDFGLMKKVVFMGNSITEAWPVNSPAFFEDHHYINKGISGQTTPQMLLRFQRDVIDLNPEAVVILAGTNDIAGNTGYIPIETIAGNIQLMADEAKRHGIKVILCAVLPAIDYPWKPGLHPAEKIMSLNKLIKSYAEAHDIPYVDYHAVMVDDKGGLKVPEFTSADDLVHPNKAGYEVMEAQLQPVIEKVCGQ